MVEANFSMQKIEYIETDRHGLDSIGFLWEKLNEHHRVRSLHFIEHFDRMTWDVRKKELLEKSVNGSMRVDIAKDVKTGKYIGYCISTVNAAKMGEIESIFIEKDYRRQGIGDNFMKKALQWMDGLSVTKRIIGVAAGNEEAFPFYAGYNFYPGVTIMRQPEITKE
jgi:GNAT superfamily N-acetyltransferase